MLEEEQIVLIVYSTVILLFFIVFGILFFIAFQRRKNKLLLSNLKKEQEFKAALQNSKLEIQEQTLKNVSWELHDNIGQLLSTAIIHINMLNTNRDQKIAGSVEDIKKLVADSLQEIRSLSKTLNHEVITNIGLKKSVRNELSRFEKLNFLKTQLTVMGEEKLLNPKDEIIIYRIIQEFFSNSVKHAKASNLKVLLNYDSEKLQVVIKDDGIGYDMRTVQANSGLLNMQSRAALIDASMKLVSEIDKGVSLSLEYPFTKNLDKEQPSKKIHQNSSF